MGNNLDLGIVNGVHLQLPSNSEHLKKQLSKNYTILETKPKPRSQGWLSSFECSSRTMTVLKYMSLPRAASLISDFSAKHTPK